MVISEKKDPNPAKCWMRFCRFGARNDFRMLHYSFLHHKILSNRLFVNQSRQVCGKISDSPKKGFLGFDQNGKNGIPGKAACGSGPAVVYWIKKG